MVFHGLSNFFFLNWHTILVKLDFHNKSKELLVHVIAIFIGLNTFECFAYDVSKHLLAFHVKPVE